MEKRALPTRHNFLTEAVKRLLETDSSTIEPILDINTIITVTSDVDKIKDYKDTGLMTIASPSFSVENSNVKLITPVKRAMNDTELDLIPDDFYIKRHRRHELEEKKQKNREKERLKHGYYQQNQLVERIKMMDKSSLQSIVSSIRHRTKETEEKKEDEETYLDTLHERLLKDATELLNRYEALGISKPATVVEGIEEFAEKEVNPIFHEAVKVEAIRQKARQLTTFDKHIKAKASSRRSSRHVTAFGVKLPEFRYSDYELPAEVSKFRLLDLGQ